MKIYLAASSADIARAKHWHQKLLDAGIKVTSTWIATVESVGNANPRDASTQERLGWSYDDLSQVVRSDVFWFLVPGVETPTRGAWIEFGYAVAAREVAPDSRMAIRLIASGDTKQSIFCALATEFPCHKLADPRNADEKAFAAIVELARRAA